ncbi:DUF86 domain-containing protein [Candidatus Peregrinibacteria bacterium]|nr:DUF86 domain-containing protein [Candidatus Peregrinibacteria bacterium]
MKKGPEIFLQYIFESIEIIESYTAHLTKSEFLSNLQAQDSVIRRLEIIGEASKGLPASLKKAHPEIPWKQVAGLRDILIHEYFGVDLQILWPIVKKDLPALKKVILKNLNGRL